MSTHFPDHRHPDDEAAALWAARLDGGGMTPADFRELETWLAAGETRFALVSRYTNLSVILESRVPVLAAQDRVDWPAEVLLRRRRPWLAWAVGGLAAAAAAVAVTVWVGQGTGATTEQYAAAAGEQRALVLGDGTRVDIFAQTRIAVALGRTERSVRLDEGEAYFAVAKDPQRPFTVETPAGSVRVTGTEFDVRADGDGRLHVVVAEGSVVVRPAAGTAAEAAPVALAAGGELVAGAGAVTVRELAPAALADQLAWRRGQAVFDGTPLSAAVARFARYHGRTIRLSADSASLRIGGRFSLGDLDGFLAAVEEVLPVKVTRLANGQIELSRRVDDNRSPNRT